MKKARKIALMAAVASVALLGGAKLSLSDQAPTQNQGVAAKMVGSMDLKPEIDSIGDRQLRMRYVTLEPGGVFAAHSHKDRPAVEFVLKGNVTEFRGPNAKEYKDGESVISDKETTHWWRNDGSSQVVFLVVDVFNPPK